MNTRELTGGRDRDKGWTQTPEGNWVPSLWDRRRVAVAEMQAVAEANGLPGVPLPIAQIAVVRNSTSMEDAGELFANFARWAGMAAG